MTDRRLFYHLRSGTDTPCHLTREAHAEALNTWLCPGCSSPKPGVTSVDVRIQVAPTKDPLNGVFGAGVPIASRKLLTAIDSNLIERDLYLGRVYGPDGRELEAWATFRGKHRLIVRGSEEAQYRTCEICGRMLYFAMGKSYLYPAPPAGVSVFESDLRGLILAEQAFQQSSLENLRGIHIEKLPAVDVPKDSFGELTIDSTV
jgi:hypothetical protein